jgi:hypothetical protein
MTDPTPGKEVQTAVTLPSGDAATWDSEEMEKVGERPLTGRTHGPGGAAFAQVGPSISTPEVTTAVRTPARTLCFTSLNRAFPVP